MVHRAPGRRRSQGPCFFCHWTPEPCLKKRIFALSLVWLTHSWCARMEVTWLGPFSPPKGCLAAASPTSHARDNERWPPARSFCVAGPRAGYARNTRGLLAIGVALARQPRRPIGARPAHLRGYCAPDDSGPPTVPDTERARSTGRPLWHGERGADRPRRRPPLPPCARPLLGCSAVERRRGFAVPDGSTAARCVALGG